VVTIPLFTDVAVAQLVVRTTALTALPPCCETSGARTTGTPALLIGKMWRWTEFVPSATGAKLADTIRSGGGCCGDITPLPQPEFGTTACVG